MAEKKNVAFKSRIVGEGEEDPTQLLANPLNWRVHPNFQKEGVRDALKEIGFIQRVIVNKTTGHLVDGHLRVSIAMEEGLDAIPVEYVELTIEEEKKALATLDPLTGLAATDGETLGKLMDGIQFDGSVLQGAMDDLLQSVTPAEPPPLVTPNPQTFWPRVSIQLQPNVYSDWREMWDELEGDSDTEKVQDLLDKLERA